MRGEIRSEVWRSLGHSPIETDDAKARANAAINAALVQLYAEVPDCFLRDELVFHAQEDFVPVTADTISVALDGAAADPWCFPRDSVTGTYTAWNLDGTWSGRTLQITTSDGIMHRRTIRSVFLLQFKGGSYECISVVEPWDVTRYPYAASAEMSYRVVTDDYPLPSRFGKITSIRESTPRGGIIQVVTEEEGRQYDAAYPHGSMLQPGLRIAYRRPLPFLNAPGYAPVATLVETVWAGPYPYGTYEFLYTYTFGAFDAYHGAFGARTQTAPSASSTPTFSYRRTEPLFESKPSASVRITNARTSQIRLSLPDVDFMLGFGGDGTYRYHQSGVKKRIYVRTVTPEYDSLLGGGNSRPSGWAAATPVANIEAKDGFYLLDVVDGYTAEYTWVGSVIPDWNRRLNAAGVSTVLRIQPRFSAATLLTVDAIASAAPMLDDYDSTPLRPTAEQALVFAAAASLAGQEQNWAVRKDMQDRYQDALRHIRTDQGTALPSARAHTIVPPRLVRRRW